MRLASLALLLAPATVLSEPPAEPKKGQTFERVELLSARSAKVGEMGPIATTDDALAFRSYKVYGINSPKQVLIQETSGHAAYRGQYGWVPSSRKTTLFMIDGIDTSKMVTDREIDLRGVFKATRTQKIGTDSILVLEPESDAEKTARIQADAKRAVEAFEAQEKVNAVTRANHRYSQAFFDGTVRPSQMTMFVSLTPPANL
jgi:hypothetical protein